VVALDLAMSVETFATFTHKQSLPIHQPQETNRTAVDVTPGGRCVFRFHLLEFEVWSSEVPDAGMTFRGPVTLFLE
jgi:hypothetical protein